MSKRKKLTLVVVAIGLLFCLYSGYTFIMHGNFNPNRHYTLDQPIDSMNGVIVYYNGMVGRTNGRNLSADGYNIGMKHQCVEFVKRYYYQHLKHKMPDAFGNAKDFFDAALPDSTLNVKRGLVQFRNRSKSKPRAEDLLIFGGHAGNKFGHVAIVSFAGDSTIGIIQQNPGPFGKSRDTFALLNDNGQWVIHHNRALGWLRKDTTVY